MRAAAAVVGLVLASACGAATPPSPPAESAVVSASAARRIVAVGDLHGDLDNALAVLRLAGVVDAEGRWALGEGVFVQTGDLTDRGPDSRALIALMARLESEASAAGGRVVALIGNHEAMNVHGDWRYVHPGDVAAYGGLDARRAAFSAEGADGAWVRAHPAAAIVGDALFVHGGVHPDFAALGVDGLNAAVRAGLEAPGAPAHGEQGPLWYRAYVTDPEEEACPRLERALAAVGARRMVVGHTTRRNGRIQTRCGGRLAVIDVGIADHYGGNLAAWTWSDGDAAEITPAGRHDLEDPAP